MGGFGGIIDKAKNFAGKHADKVEQGIEKVGDTVDQRTGGKYTAHVDKAQAKAGDLLNQATPAGEQSPSDTAPR